MKSDNSIGVLFGLLSWGVLFAFLLSSDTPSPRCAYCEGRYNTEGANEQNASGVLPAASSSGIAGGVSQAEKSKLQAYSAEHNEYHRLKAAFEHRGIEPNWWQSYIAIGAFIVASIQACFFFVQLRKMDESLRDSKAAIQETRKSDERQLRPYVSIRISLFPTLTANIPVGFHFICTNHGQSPAVNLSYRAKPIIDKDANFKVDDLPPISGDWNQKRMNLFPNSNLDEAKKPILKCNLGLILTPQEVYLVGALRPLIIGIEVEYGDIFDPKNIYRTQDYFILQLDANKNVSEVLTIPGKSVLT